MGVVGVGGELGFYEWLGGRIWNENEEELGLRMKPAEWRSEGK